MLLFDTCTLLLLAGSDKKLPERSSSAIQEYSDALYISSISAFEIALKFKLGKLILPKPPNEWYKMAMDLHGINEIPVSSDIAILSAELPFIHKDPCDRMIIATALKNRLKIITPDKIIPEYSDVKTLWD